MKRALVVVVILCGCSDDDSGGGGACGEVPPCLGDALADLRACVTTPNLTLMGSGDFVSCSGGDLTVMFHQPANSGAVPDGATLRIAGTTCANILTGYDFTSDGERYDVATILRPSTPLVGINRYSDGAFGFRCGSPDETIIATGTLAACPASYASPIIVRDEATGTMTVQLVDAASVASTLFTCRP